MISWIIAAFSLTGTVLNAKGSIWGFYLWIPANIAWVVYDFINGIPAQSILFIAYTGISVYGIYSWKKKGIK